MVWFGHLLVQIMRASNESASEPPNITPVQMWTLASHQTLHLSRFERSATETPFRSFSNLDITPFGTKISGNIPDCHKWTEEHRTVKKHPFGTFTLASHFLTLAQVWRTFWILECTKQGFKPARDHLAATQKTCTWESSNRVASTMRRIYITLDAHTKDVPFVVYSNM